MEYILLLGMISGALYFAAPALGNMRQVVNDTFVCATRRMLSDGVAPVQCR